MVATSVFDAARACLDACAVEDKIAMTSNCAAALRVGALNFESTVDPLPIGEAGRPGQPELVPPADVPLRKLGHAEGRAALIHAVAHIEFNAINLAWDAVYRFRGMPRDYYLDWARVADEEALHFRLLRDRLRELGYDYGSFTAHNGLWEMAQKTAHDVLVRMALVPRVLEARGLDVTPGMIERLKQVRDARTVEILEIILRDEIGHVATGTRWFHFLCEQRELEPEQTFMRLASEYVPKRGQRGVHRPSRVLAGFSESEMRFVESGFEV